jgi:hypothetical protein
MSDNPQVAKKLRPPAEKTKEKLLPQRVIQKAGS